MAWVQDDWNIAFLLIGKEKIVSRVAARKKHAP